MTSCDLYKLQLCDTEVYHKIHAGFSGWKVVPAQLWTLLARVKFQWFIFLRNIFSTLKLRGISMNVGWLSIVWVH